MLFEPLSIGSLELPNRILRSATWEGMADDRGRVTDRVAWLYEALAWGGSGLIVTGFAYVVPAGRALPGQLGIYTDDHIFGLSRIAAAVHGPGGRVAVQLVDAGAQTVPDLVGGRMPRGAGMELGKHGEPVSEAMSTDELGEVIEAFGKAAARVREAGFDAVQLQLAHGYLLSQFLSPARNQRTDEYGGSAENRRRAVLETYDAVRRAVGDDFPVFAKLNGRDMVAGGLELEEAVACAQELEARGLDAFEISGGIPAAGARGAVRADVASPEGEGYFRAEGAAVKRAVGVPVYTVGGLRTPTVMEEILQSGDADGVALCRPLIREATLPNRWAGGYESPAACISCRRCLKAGMQGGIACLEALQNG